MRPAGLILAAGESRRMGFPKALLTLGGETFADRLIGTLSCCCSPVIVVLGADAERIRSGIRRASEAVIAINPEFHLGMFSSLRRGLRAVPPGCPGVLFALVDHPNLLPATVARLLEQTAAPVAIPRLAGRRGHPVWIRADVAAEFLDAPLEATARQVIERHAAEIVYVDVEDPAVTEDIDDPEAYNRALGGAAQ